MAPLGEEAREKSPEKLFFFSATFSRGSNSSNLSQRLSVFLQENEREHWETLERKSQSCQMRQMYFL